MENANEQVILILCKLERIFHPAFFDIMVHFVMHLLEEAILGGSVYMRWMYPFERYLKILKDYVRNPAKPEGSIAEEALTFCSRYFDDIETRFNQNTSTTRAMFHKRNAPGLIRALTRVPMSVIRTTSPRPTNTTRDMAAQSPTKILTWLSGVIARTYSRAHHSRMRLRGMRAIEPRAHTKACRGLRVSWQHAMPTNPETEEWVSILDTWKSTHTRHTDQGEIWVSKQAEGQYLIRYARDEGDADARTPRGCNLTSTMSSGMCSESGRATSVELAGRSPAFLSRHHRLLLQLLPGSLRVWQNLSS